MQTKYFFKKKPEEGGTTLNPEDLQNLKEILQQNEMKIEALTRERDSL